MRFENVMATFIRFFQVQPAQFAVLACWLFLAQAAFGNPVVPPKQSAYIDSEKLEVVAGADAAEIKGTFQFRSTNLDGEFIESMGIMIHVPVWIPASPKEGDNTVSRFLAEYGVSMWGDPNGANRSTWDAAIGLKLRVGKKEIAPRGFSILRESETPPIWRREGWLCVEVRILVSPELMARRFFGGIPKTVISYRQPLRKTADGKSEFFYVPTFESLPAGRSTDDIHRYSMRIKSTVTGGVLPFATSGTTVVPLKHGVPVTFQIQQP